MICIIWWFLLGLLLGLLLFWLIDKLFRRTGESELESSRSEIQRLRAQLADADAQTKSVTDKEAQRLAAAKFGFMPEVKGRDNLTIVEGIGPKIEQLLFDANINTFADLAKQTPEHLTSILEAAGSRFKLANPKSWPTQADLCVKQDWAALKEYQDYLDGGVDLADRQKD